MGDSAEPQVNPTVNGTKEDVQVSRTDPIVLKILSGERVVISHGASQYQAGGISACGLAALNCARIVLTAEQDGPKGKDLLKFVVRTKTAHEITSICAQWSSPFHLEVEEIYKVPLFSKSLKLETSEFGLPSFERFRSVLSRLATSGTKSAAIVITRPPEIFTCVKISIPDDADVFMVFDSHSRPDHPDGAGFIFSTSIDTTAQHLYNLLAIDESILSDRTLQWQTQLLANFSGLLFVAKTNRFDTDPIEAERAMVESSLIILSLQAEVAELKSQNAALQRDLQAAVLKVEDDQRSSHKPSSSSKPSKKFLDSTWIPAPTKKKHRKKKNDNSSSGPTDYRPTPPAAVVYHSGEIQDTDWPPLPSLKSEQRNESYLTPRSSPPPSSRTPTPPVSALDEDGSTLVLKELQQEFDDEDSRLRTEREALANAQPFIFTCAVCTDEFPEDFVARVPGCGHGFCRECLRKYAVSKLEEHRFPILCPSCLADNTGKEPGTITSSLIIDIGISQDYFQIFDELQLSSFSILLHCRKCKKSMFVDRSEYQESRTINCPLPKCGYAWCKACQAQIDIGGPRHSCDGSSELRHLMKEQGWKHCPGCDTPIQKESGCHHMICLAPACNAHFCYVCGKLIVKSALRSEIQAAVSQHYRSCRLFDDVPARRRR
ncbi:hypothetical protein BJ322DRAFT_1102725 [Thelephora terrestris]|uniref:RBR-type E3 ubiquitin transferase n=1 Tax=Thelephora terrestris TaxID=56493 RepID=A0A9P6LBB3_9AGAM|nr:hypothetical protein BJ322DRAFT_1102725 [Thelephora terrestris]